MEIFTQIRLRSCHKTTRAGDGAKIQNALILEKNTVPSGHSDDACQRCQFPYMASPPMYLENVNTKEDLDTVLHRVSGV